MNIAIVSGGTGGHIYPGIAIAQEIKRRDPKASILFLGSEVGLERKLIPREGFDIRFIKARPLLRRLSIKAFLAPFISATGFFQSLSLLKDFSPKVLVSTGGYVSFPVVLAAKVLRIPIILQEQNVLPGSTNRLCSWFAKKIFLSFAETKDYLKGEVVGNPVRKAIISADRDSARKKYNLTGKVVLVIGGSQGARHINEVVAASLDNLPPGISILHIVGERDYDWVKRYLQEKTITNYHPISYLHDIAEALAAADLVVSRAGATAIAEFLVKGIPMILIPYPYASNDHQRLNAEAIASKGGAVVIDNKDFTPDKFISILNNTTLNYDKIRNAVASQACPDAAERIVNYIYA